MNQVVRFAAISVISGCLGLGALALGSGAAQADDYYWFNWCPGEVPPPGSQDRGVDWDWNVCHTYRYQSNGSWGSDLIDDTGRVYPAVPPPPGSTCGTDLFTGIPIPC